MPFIDDVTCTPNVAKPLGNAAIKAAAIENTSLYNVQLMATLANVAPVAPDGWKGAKSLRAGEQLLASTPLITLFPNFGDVNVYLWALAPIAATLSVAHA